MKKNKPNKAQFGGRPLAGSGRGGLHRNRLDRDAKRQRMNWKNKGEY